MSKPDLDRLAKLRNSRKPPDFPETFARATAEMSASALQGNYHAIRKLAGDKFLVPMIKANAYGHGLEWAAKHLFALDGLYALGVATLEEGRAAREALGPRGRRTRIIVFSGTVPWSDEKGRFCEAFGLIATVAREEDWRAFLKGGWPGRVGYQIKFNTGMNRLGLPASLARAVAKDLERLAPEARPEGVLTHLAMAEAPEASLSRTQRQKFLAIRGEFAGAFPSVQFHLANSSAIWGQKEWGLDNLTDVVRPGISLYGVPPWPGAAVRGIEPVMTFKAAVIAVNPLRPGDQVGYGGTYQVGTKGGQSTPSHVAVLSAGYGDGLHRALSNRGHAWLGGRAERFLGIVSMDLSAISCDSSARVGDYAEILGPRVDIWAQAKEAGTIPYELLTSVSGRVERIYG